MRVIIQSWKNNNEKTPLVEGKFSSLGGKVVGHTDGTSHLAEEVLPPSLTKASGWMETNFFTWFTVLVNYST